MAENTVSSSKEKKRWLRSLLRVLLALLTIATIGLVWLMTWSSGPSKTHRATSAYFRCPCPLILAHQGASGHAPSNTLRAFQLAKQMHADILELDVHQSRDGVLVVSHDKTVDRLTNGKGLIKDKTFAQLKQLDAGYHFSADGRTTPYRGKGIEIPALREVFTTFPRMRFNIEIKQSSPPLERRLWELIRKHELEDRVLIAGFRSEALLRWRKVAKQKAVTSASIVQALRFVAFWRLGLEHHWSSDIDAMQLPARLDGRLLSFLSSRAWLRSAHKHGLKVHYWTVNNPSDMKELLKRGADGIITDFPDRAWRVMKELKLR